MWSFNVGDHYVAVTQDFCQDQNRNWIIGECLWWPRGIPTRNPWVFLFDLTTISLSNASCIWTSHAVVRKRPKEEQGKHSSSKTGTLVYRQEWSLLVFVAKLFSSNCLESHDRYWFNKKLLVDECTHCCQIHPNKPVTMRKLGKCNVVYGLFQEKCVGKRGGKRLHWDETLWFVCKM